MFQHRYLKNTPGDQPSFLFRSHFGGNTGQAWWNPTKKHKTSRSNTFYGCRCPWCIYLRSRGTLWGRLTFCISSYNRISPVETQVCFRSSRNAASHTSTIIIALHQCHEDSFPNIRTLLLIACTLPMTTCENERANSQLKLLKACLRSTIYDWGETFLTSNDEDSWSFTKSKTIRYRWTCYYILK